METDSNRQIGGSHIYTYLFMAYFLLTPMEDILNSSAGTFVKYLAIFVIMAGVLENKGKVYLNHSTENICIIWMMIVSVASICWSIDINTTAHRLVTYLLIPAFCLYASTLDFTQKEFDQIITSAIIGGVLSVLFALSSGSVINEYMAERMVLSEGNDPNNFAAFLLLPLTMTWYRIQEERKQGYKAIYIMSLLILFFGVLMTGSRGALLSVLVMFFVYYFVNRKRKQATGIIGGIIIVVILLIVLRRFLPSNLVFRLFTLSNYTSGGAGRTEVWRTIFKSVIPRMGVFGLGAGCVSVKLIPYYGFAKGVHNTYLNMICEFGILGIPAFVIMLFTLIKKNIKHDFLIGVALLVAICTTIFFLDSYAKKFFWNVILLLFIHDKITNIVIFGERNKKLF